MEGKALKFWRSKGCDGEGSGSGTTAANVNVTSTPSSSDISTPMATYILSASTDSFHASSVSATPLVFIPTEPVNFRANNSILDKMGQLRGES